MYDIGNVKVPLCSGVSRRSFLKVGGLSTFGLSLADLIRSQAQAATTSSPSAGRKEPRSAIVLFLVGGPSHIDTWDPKPDAPKEIRNIYPAISTSVPGTFISENFPLMAQRMHKIALVRSLHHTEAAIHESGHQYMMTGNRYSGGRKFPHLGSVISAVYGQKSALPPNVILPGTIGATGVSESHGQEAAFLGKAHEPFFLNGDPGDPEFKVGSLSLPAGQVESRVANRRDLLKELDQLQRRTESQQFEALDQAYERAFSLVLAPETKKAFNLDEEKPEVRDRYGRNTFGQSCLLARRLIERGVRMCTVNHFNTVFNITCWDMHSNGSSLNPTIADYRQVLCPQFDLAYSALLDDLEERGLLSETVVSVVSEMGRTPRINPNGGRDHHPGVWTNFLAGGSVKGGVVVGSSDKQGAKPHARPVTPAQFCASVYHAMGIDLDQTMMPGPGGRPIRFVEAEPIRELF
jgi:uncharacterized protein (DUF1501 family)